MARSKRPQGRPSALGGIFHAANEKINTLQKNVLTATVNWRTPPGKLISILVDQDTQRILREAKGKIYLSGGYYTPDPTYRVLSGVRITIPQGQWGAQGMEALAPNVLQGLELSAVTAQHPANELVEDIHKVNNVVREFTLVRKSLEWLDENATLGAMRYYWPSVMSLIDDYETKSKLFPDTSGRFVHPAGVSTYVPLFRETAGIVAKGLLAPEDDTLKKHSIMLHFDVFSWHQSGFGGVTCPATSVAL